MVENLFGIGFYTIPEASHLLQMDAHTIRRWVKGYSYRLNETVKKVKPLIKTSVPIVDDKFVLSFLELIELYVVKRFLDNEIPLQKIRLAAIRAAEILKVNNPFAYRMFKFRGKSIFMEQSLSESESTLLELCKNQYALQEIMKLYLHEIDFSELESPQRALRWFPMGKERPIVIDPAIAFGKPVILATRIPAETLYRDYLAEKSAKSVADWYEISVDKVEAAIEFMESLKAA
jgi:uncharacterized protein (DUF433 family)